jgi:hypothetical protein
VEGARIVCKEVGVAELEAYIYARKLRAINGVRGRGEGHHNFDACVRGGLSGGRSKGEVPPFFKPSMYTKSCQFQVGSPLVGEYVSVVRSGRG